MSLLVLNPFLCLLSPIHPVICRCFKAMSLVGILPKQDVINLYCKITLRQGSSMINGLCM